MLLNLDKLNKQLLGEFDDRDIGKTIVKNRSALNICVLCGNIDSIMTWSLNIYNKTLFHNLRNLIGKNGISVCALCVSLYDKSIQKQYKFDFQALVKQNQGEEIAGIDFVLYYKIEKHLKDNK